MAERQLVLDLRLRPATERADFMVAPCNEAAVAQLDRWPDWPGGGLVLAGPPASGKSHLAAVWRRESGARPIDAASLDEADPVALAEARTHWLIEDADRLVAGWAERERGLFHLFNAVRARGGDLMLTARSPATRWPIALPDLASRVRGMLAAQIGPPDDTLLGALLVKLFADRQLRATRPALDYMLRRMDRSFAGVERVVATIDAHALSARREINRGLVRELFASGRLDD